MVLSLLGVDSLIMPQHFSLIQTTQQSSILISLHLIGVILMAGHLERFGTRRMWRGRVELLTQCWRESQIS